MEKKPNKIFRTAVLVLILVWATIFFWLLNPIKAINIVTVVISIFSLMLILLDRNINFNIIYLTFITSYVLYGYMLTNNFPVWIIMLGVLIITLYLLSYLDKKAEFAEGQKIIFLTIFSLIILELFMFLGYFLISPLNRSLLVSLTVYLFYGFCDKVLSGGNLNGMKSYLLVFLFVFATIILTASWG